MPKNSDGFNDEAPDSLWPRLWAPEKFGFSATSSNRMGRRRQVAEMPVFQDQVKVSAAIRAFLSGSA